MSRLAAQSLQSESLSTAPTTLADASCELSAQILSNNHKEEVLVFLAEHPARTFYLAGLIRDNGLVNPLNRGTFYGCRNDRGELEGVGLIGHATLVETHSVAALKALARVARDYPRVHVLIGEWEKMDQFWHYYRQTGTPRLRRRKFLFGLTWPVALGEPVFGLRQATINDLTLVMPVQAQMVLTESGIDPLQVDLIGFRLRCARRIEQGRVWVCVEGGRLMFKIDVISDTPGFVYLEGMYSDADESAADFESRCLAHLSRRLLARTRSIGVAVDERDAARLEFFKRAGFKRLSCYDTIYLHQKES